jgi:Na+/H+ antiporter NhaD/arsenite permease-like protein
MPQIQLIVFILFFILIVLEDKIKLNKTSTALMSGVFCWLIASISGDSEIVLESLKHHIADISEILFFLLSAMVIVELIDIHDGFVTIARKIKSSDKNLLIVKISLVTFFFSAIIDNLTTAIVMISILRKLVKNDKTILFLSSLVILNSNAGGAWSPLGDVTTTMLWIGGQISATGVMKAVLFPSILFGILSTIYVIYRLKNDDFELVIAEDFECSTNSKSRNLILYIGLGVFFFVPVFKYVTHFPPYMGMLIGLAFVWLISEIINYKKDVAEREKLSASYALSRIDSSSILFFLGILLAVSSLEQTGQLKSLASVLTQTFQDNKTIAFLLGIVSATVDNVPLVAGAMNMFDINSIPQDNAFWHQLAFCTGTGGSILVIGSAAGVAVMGMTEIKFMWYLKNISLPSLLIYIVCNFFL